MADLIQSTINTVQNYKEDPIPAALVAVGGAVVLKFALKVRNFEVLRGIESRQVHVVNNAVELHTIIS